MSESETLLTIYILSALQRWLHVHLLYGKSGILYECNPGLSNVLSVFIPLVNTVLIVFWIIFWPFERPIKKPRKEINTSKFFRIK